MGRKEESRALGPHFNNQPYDLEQAKVQRPSHKEKKEIAPSLGLAGIVTQGNQHSVCFPNGPQMGY